MTSLLVPLAVGSYREFRRRQWRHRLAALPPHQRAAVLLSLRDHDGETRRLVAPLLREWRLPADLTPADPPLARGDEPAPAA
jgi:hypothetical protein